MAITKRKEPRQSKSASIATMANRTRPRQTELYWKWAWSISSRLGERRRAQSVYGDREERKYPSLYGLGTLAQTSGNKQNTGGDVDKAVGKENRESHDKLLETVGHKPHNGSVCFKTATCMESNHLGIDALHNGPHEPLVKGGEWGIVQAPIQQIIVGGVAIPSRSSQR